MVAVNQRRSHSVLADLANQIYEEKIKPFLKKEDEGKFVVIAVDHGDHEINEDDYTAISRLRSRNPHSEFWLMRVGRKTAYRFGSLR